MKYPAALVLLSAFSLMTFFLSSVYAKPASSDVAEKGFCCVNGELLTNRTEKQCQQVKGKYFPAEQAARAGKSCESEKGYCCVDGKLHSGKSKSACRKQGGSFYGSKDAAQARKSCRPKKGYCCVDGKLHSGKSESACRKQGGSFYDSKDAAQARKSCRPEKGYCCVDGKLYSGKSESECKKQRGTFYDARDAVRARKLCRSEKGYCCVDGKLYSGKSESDCKKQRGTFYGAKDAAHARKSCQSKKGVCCVNGKAVSGKSEKECRKLQGTFQENVSGSRAKPSCKEETGFCCSDGKLLSSTPERCRKVKGGKFFASRSDAAKNCGKSKALPTGKKPLSVRAADGAGKSGGSRGKQAALITGTKAETPGKRSENKLKTVKFAGRSVDREMLLGKTLQRQTLIKKGPSSKFRQRTVEVAEGATDTLENISKAVFAKQDELKKELQKVKESSGILVGRPVAKSETFEFKNSFVLVKSTSAVVADPRALARKSPEFKAFLGSSRTEKISFSSLNDESREGLKELISNELPNRPKDDPLRIAAEKGGMEGLLAAIAEGKGVFEITEEVVVPKKLPPVLNGLPQLPEMKNGVLVYDRFRPPGKKFMDMTAPETIPGSVLDGREALFPEGMIPEDESTGSTSSRKMVKITKGNVRGSFNAQFMTGHTLSANVNYQRTWRFESGLFRINMGAGYSIGLRFPVQVRGNVSPTWITVKGPRDAETDFETSITASPVDADCTFFRSTGLSDGSAETCGKELALDFYFSYGLKFRALYTTVLHIPVSEVHTPPWSKDFTPPFASNGGGLAFWIPPEVTHTDLDLGVVSGYLKAGFKLGGTGTVSFDYQSFHGDDVNTGELIFSTASPVKTTNILAPMDVTDTTTTLEETYGFKLYNPEYRIHPSITPGINVSMKAGYKSFSRSFSYTTWLNSLEVLLLPVSFERHSGTTAEYSWREGVKKFEKR